MSNTPPHLALEEFAPCLDFTHAFVRTLDQFACSANATYHLRDFRAYSAMRPHYDDGNDRRSTRHDDQRERADCCTDL